MYPIVEYMEAGINFFINFKRLNRDPRRLNDIINCRYRSKGFEICWLFFGQEGFGHLPDLGQLSTRIDINSRDMKFSCGVSFRDHVTNRHYPDPNLIVDQLGPAIANLRIGGFHAFDCVDKVARAAYEKGIDVMVDDDTTELFFNYMASIGLIPFERPSMTLEGFGFSPQAARFMRDGRDKNGLGPWFIR